MQRPVHDRLVLEHIDPVARRRRRWLILILVILTCAATYLLGNFMLRTQLQNTRERLTELQSELLQSRAKSERLVSENAELMRAAQVDKASVERVREDLNALTQRLTAAQSELDVYRRLAAASVDAEVAQPFSLALQQGVEPGRWLVQLALIRAYASDGEARVRLKLQVSTGGGMDALVDEREVTMEYFRVISLSFELEPEQTPVKLSLTVQQAEQSPQTLELPWQALLEQPWRSTAQ